MKRWMTEQIELAGGPKALALKLRRAGYPPDSDQPYSERGIASWREPSGNWPPSYVVWAIAQLNTVSLDATLLEGHLKRTLTERFQDHEARIAEAEGHIAELTEKDRTRLDITAAALVVLGEHVGFDVLGWVRKAHRGDEDDERAEDC